jgi:hypothetical protein
VEEIVVEDRMNFKMEKENINWQELKEKVDADIQKDIDNEIQTVKDINFLFGDEKGITNLKPIDVNIDPFNLWGNQNNEDENIESEGSEDNECEEDESEEDDSEDIASSYDCDYCDQGGFICPHSEIEKCAWNNADKKSDIECIHLSNKDNLDKYNDDVYIYPINKEQDISLCKDCNRELASKIMEQMATELFL